MLNIPGAEHLIDSTGFLDLPRLPDRILFVGGGFVSFEFAHIAARTSSYPTIIDRGARPLKGFDPDLVDLLVAAQTPDRHGHPYQYRAASRGNRLAGGYQVTLDIHGQDSAPSRWDLVVHGASRDPMLGRAGTSRRPVSPTAPAG